MYMSGDLYVSNSLRVFAFELQLDSGYRAGGSCLPQSIVFGVSAERFLTPLFITGA